MNNNWLNHPQMKNLDPVKLDLILNAASQVNGKSGSSMAAVMMSLINAANKKGIRFTPAETSLILEILKDGKSPKEKAYIDHLVNTVISVNKKKGN